VFELVAEGIEPVIEDLAAHDVAANAPGGLAAGGLEMLVAEHQVIEIGNFESGVEQSRRAGQLREEQGVMVARHVAPVTAQEGAEGHALGRFDLVRGDEAEARLVPGL